MALKMSDPFLNAYESSSLIITEFQKKSLFIQLFIISKLTFDAPLSPMLKTLVDKSVNPLALQLHVSHKCFFGGTGGGW